MRLVKENELYEVYRVGPRDWERIKECITKIENSAFEEEVRQDEEDLGQTFTYKKSVCLIAVHKNRKRIVGYIMGAPLDWYAYLEDDDHYGKNDSFYIESTAVLPEYQGKGVGKILKEALIEEVRKKGYKRITSHATNEIIKHINEKFGFRVIGFVKRWVGKRDAWYMEKLL